MSDALARSLASVMGGPVVGLTRLSGGASRETWSFDGPKPYGPGPRPLILQRRRPGSSDLSGDVGLEVDLLRAADAAGVAVPKVVAWGDGTSDAMGAPWMVCERVEGEALPRRLLRDEAFSEVRQRLAFQCGAALATIHAIDPGRFVDQLAAGDQIARLREALDFTSGDHPALEAGFRWLELHPPPPRAVAVVHGDFRTGNILVRPDTAASPGLAAVLDWELAHLGNPVEDLGWFCVRAWRFGSSQRAGGFGPAEQLLEGYRSAGGVDVTPAELDWWELFGTLRWGVICAVQAESHLSSTVRSVELATVGRRACENEYDALRILGAVFPLTIEAAIAAPTRTLHDRPTAVELIEAVREFLERDVTEATEGRVRFHARVAANALSIVERELRSGGEPAAAHERRLAELGIGSDSEFAAAVRSGALDDRWDAVLTALAATVADKVRVANPNYLADSDGPGGGTAGLA